MKVWHGSHIVIDKVDLSKCLTGRDFGRGFYVTKFRSQAEYWAERMGERKGTAGAVTEFDFEDYVFEDGDDDIKTLRFDYYSEDWFDFVMLNRQNKRDNQVHDYDIIEGPVADDAVTTRIIDYIAGKISKMQFLEELKFKRPSHQICFCTIKSLQMLEISPRIKTVSDMMHTDDDIIETLMSEFGWTDTKATDAYYTSKTWLQLVDENTGLYKKTWTEIYNMLLQELNLKK